MGYVLGIDFDGTCVTHEFPYIGDNIGAEIVLKALQDEGWKFVLISMRDHAQIGKYGFDPLDRAIAWFKLNGINVYGVNENPDQAEWSQSRKIYANVYIDDQFLGCPLIFPTNAKFRPHVDWMKVTDILAMQCYITLRTKAIIERKLHEEYPLLYNNLQNT